MLLKPPVNFDANEIFILITLLLTYSIAYLMPKKFPRQITFLLFFWGFTVPKFLDFTVGGGLVDYYDVNDTPQYDIFDLVSYFIYAPFAYFFIYLYEWLKITTKTLLFYLVAWGLIAIGMEWVSVLCKMIIYKKGYHLTISFCIQLFILSVTLLYYKLLTNQIRFSKRT